MNRILFATAFGTALLLGPAFADDKKIDEKAAMEAMMKAAAVGEHHKKLEPMIGEWEINTKFYMDPSQPPAESKGSAVNSWMLGNRYFHQTIKGEFGGMKFEGAGVIGYDNLQKKYVFAWIDNMGTGIEHGVGHMDKDGKVLTFHHEEIDPLTGKMSKGKDVTTIIDNDNFKTEFYKVEGDKEIKMMDVFYKRKK
jgi:hypothetical protein